MRLPVHRWFRYSAGYSANWVETLIKDKKQFVSNLAVLDPFAGIGTTLVASNVQKIRSFGFEAHPFIYRIARTKLRAIELDDREAIELYDEFFSTVITYTKQINLPDSPLIQKCYSEDALTDLITLRDVFLSKFDFATPYSELLWVTITSILRACSTAGTAQWQYVLPNKTKSKVLAPYEAFKDKANQIISDIQYTKQNNWPQMAQLIQTDSRIPSFNPSEEINFVITSPPYPNNYDYADSTRLEMMFWEEISGWADLQSRVRQYLVRSCSQHSAAERLELETLLEAPVLAPIREELADACDKLATIRLTKGGRKTYHTMAAAYFKDLGDVLHALNSIVSKTAEMCFVIGDSAPYGIYLPVDRWLGELALEAGFSSYHFEKIRDRNTKWKNRKHSVPLKEGHLWITR
ncbi:MAG: DNA modification methylase [Ardenticatenaceae bacterium]|nr:DNA modification methylase [Ardenticatenaceae bacterium]